ncbi:MAG: hypothetical protein LLG97_02260 [Deltaproteobacteria bacterium]|nr:hypothetical protein [Deltaproteobacteria bacterium]
MKNKIIDMSRLKSLKTLVEDFLERDYSQLETFYKNHRTEALSVFANIFLLLGDSTFDPEDLTPDELRDTILEWHQIISPVWKKIRGAYLDYRDNIQPKGNSFSGLYLTTDEKTYAIKLKRSPITITLSFDSGKFSISMEGIRVVDRFLLQLKDAPIEIFSVCDHCGKIIIITRMGKRFHSGCASKAKQKEMWTRDPDGCREKERIRYHRRVRGD